MKTLPRLVAILCTFVCAIAAAAGQSAALKIVVIEGEAGVNVVQQRTAIPIVEVRDRNDQPVVGATVTFAIRGGRATFNGARALTVVTDALGRASAAGLTPTASGAVQISASAAFQGQVATATIAQMNVMTAAQAASLGSGGSGGGLSATTIAVVGGAAGAGGLIAKERLDTDYVPPEVSMYGAEFGFAPNAVLTRSISANIVEGGFLTWDFGDGETYVGERFAGDRVDNGPRPLHVYQSAGVYTVRFTLTDSRGTAATAEDTFTVKSMSGQWDVSNGAAAEFTQNAGTITGTWRPTPVSAPLPLTGTVDGSVRFTVQTGTGSFTFNGSALSPYDLVSGSLSGTGFIPSVSVTLNRR